MGTQKIIAALGRWLGRTWVLILIGALTSVACVDMDYMRMKMLNRVMPASMEDLVAFSLDPATRNPPAWDRYTLYFETAAKILPKLSAPRGLLGYCYYYMGDMDEAERQYKNAIALNPNVFWSYYNLGIIYARQVRYAEAAAMMKKAAACAPSDFMMLLKISKFYRELNKQAEDLGYNSEQGLIRGYSNAKQIQMFFQYNLGAFVEKNYRVQLF